MRYYLRLGSGLTLVLGIAGTAIAQDNTPVSRAEYNQLLEKVEALTTQLEGRKNAPTSLSDVNIRIDDLEDQFDDYDDQLSDLEPGTNNFLMSGYAYAQYTDKDGSNSSFDTRFFPIFNWKLSDKLFASAELEVELKSDSYAASHYHKVVLEYLELDYIVNDWLTLKAGKFLSPLSTFKEQLHSAWINKSVDQPLFATGGARLIPTSAVGVQATGAFAVNNKGSRLTYSLWLENGPDLETSTSKLGQMNFTNHSDNNDNKAFGARIGFFPIPELEIAYAILTGDVQSSTPGSGIANLDATIHDISFAYVVEDESIGGRIDFRGEYVESKIDPYDYGSGIFTNEREGGYLQFAYRPTMSSGNIKNAEFVLRYDVIDNPSTALDGKVYEETRWTVGLNYWLSPSAVVKFGYQFDDINDTNDITNTGNDAFMVQYAIGF